MSNVSKINGHEIADATAREAHNGFVEAIGEVLEELDGKIKNPTDYYWANVKVSSSSSNTTFPRFQSMRAGNSVYNLARGVTSGTPTATILHTGIKWVSGSYMPVLHFTGYAYGLQSPVEFKVGFYIYSDKIGYCGATNMGAWKPEIRLFRETRNEVDYVAVALVGSCYYVGLSVGIQEEMRQLGSNISLDSADWSFEFLTSYTSDDIPDGNNPPHATCCTVPYKQILNSLGKINFKLAGTTKATYTGGDTSIDFNVPNATTSASGLMTAAMVTKLNGIAENADNVSVSQKLTSGTEIGSVTVNGTATKLYAPTIPTSLPASDVYDWAKAATKPSYAYSEITGKPTLATVAISGSYNDLTNKPTIPSAYTLPVATSSARGGIKIGYSASGANIPLQLSSEKAYVALTKSAVTSALGYTPPETDTKYTLPLAASGTRGGVQIGYSESGANLALKLSSEKGYVTLSKTSVTTALGYTPPTTDTTYSVATASKAGLVKPVSVITKPTLNSVTTTAGKYYQVQMSSDGNMFVNVPWQAGSSVDLSSYATLASPTFTGTPKAPTAAKGTNTTQIATTAFVQSQGFVTSEALDDLVDKQELEGGTVNLSAYNFAGQKDNPNLTYYATDNGTTTAGTWLGKNDNVTALFDGLSVNYKVTKAGASTTTFNLNGLGAKTVYLRGTTKLTTHYEVGTIVNMIYNSTTGAWYVADYDANSYAYLRQYYTLTNTDGEYPIIYSYTKDTGTSSYKTAYGAVKGGFTFNPYNDSLSVGNINLTGSYLGLGVLTMSKGDDWADISIDGQGAGVSMFLNEDGDACVDVYGNVTVNGEPIGSGGGSTLYRHNIEITATFNGKSHVGGIFVYDTRSTKHTPETLYDMYSGQALNFSGFFGNQSGPYAFVGVIHLNGSGADAVSGLWSQAGNTTVLMMTSMTFTINDENYIVTPV